MNSLKRRISVVAALALVAGVLALGAATTPVSAASSTNTNSCSNNATGTFTDIPITLTGEATPDPATLGVDTVTLSGPGDIDPATGLPFAQATYGAFFPAAVLVAGYNLGFLVEGVNVIPADANVTLEASNSTEGSQTVGPIATTGTTTITDPDGTPGTGDETATDLSVIIPLPDTTWTPAAGGPMEFRDGGATITALVAGGLISVTFNCRGAGTTSTPAGCVADPATDCTGFTPDPRPAGTGIPFETITVIAPPAPPVCSNGSLTVGLNQSATIDLNTLCSDQNGDLDPTSYTLVTPAGNGLVTIDAAGIATYDSTTDPGAAGDSFQFTVSDLGGNGPSNVATVQVTVLANTCDATSAPCSLSQVVLFNVAGTTMTFTQANDFCDTTGEVNGFDPVTGHPIVLPGALGCQNVGLAGFPLGAIVLDGNPQVATGSLNDLTVTNARGTAAGWTVTAYSTDYGNALSPVLDFDGPGPAPEVPVCSVDAVALAAAAGAPAGTGEPDRNCISGNNMGYAPYAEIDHVQIPGDVATVTSGAASAADAAAWLVELSCAGQDIEAGYLTDPDPAVWDGATDTTTGVLTCFNGGTNGDGLVGYTGNPAVGAPQSLICSAATDVSGGTFGCDADLWLGVPASAGAGTYAGSIILTLT